MVSPIKNTSPHIAPDIKLPPMFRHLNVLDSVFRYFQNLKVKVLIK